MDEKKEAFLAKLRAIFRVEASEHLEAIAAGLVALERASADERGAIVERIFREAHSLKGAARSVSLVEAEALCQELESLFAALKRDEVQLSAERLDAIHLALGVLSTLCATPGASLSADGKKDEQRAVAALRGIVGELADTAPGPPASARSHPQEGTEPATPAPTSQPAEVPLPLPVAAVAAPVSQATPAQSPPPVSETVRISSQKLSAILLDAEQLVGAKIAAGLRAAELRGLVADLGTWNQGRVHQGARLRLGQSNAAAAADLLESELLYTRALESSLRKLAAFAHQDALTLAVINDRLLEDTRKVLLLPCSYLLGALPTVLRDMARQQGKGADLTVHGEDIEIDRRVLDELKDPLIHLLRNCVDHGIEPPEQRRDKGKPERATVVITVNPVEGNRIELSIADDGAGIDSGKVTAVAIRLGMLTAEEAARLSETERINLVFHSGLSTSPIITDLSGRGLGLAIVREKVEKLGGTLALTSSPGLGSTFRLIVPLSLTTFRGVIVEAAGQRFVFPTASVQRILRIKPDDIGTVANRPTIVNGEQPVSLVRLRDVLELTGPDGHAQGESRPVVVVRSVDRQVAFLVDEVQGEQEVMVKGLGPQLLRVRNIAGACISGNGTVIPILHAADLLESASAAGTPGLLATGAAGQPERRGHLLIAEDSITARTLVKSILEGAGYEVVATVDGLDAFTRLKTEAFDLVVSDVDMPRMNGFELTAKIRADKGLRELPVILVTALGTQSDREYGIEVGANAYIVKSEFDQSNLLEIIRRLL